VLPRQAHGGEFANFIESPRREEKQKIMVKLWLKILCNLLGNL